MTGKIRNKCVPHRSPEAINFVCYAPKPSQQKKCVFASLKDGKCAHFHKLPNKVKGFEFEEHICTSTAAQNMAIEELLRL